MFSSWRRAETSSIKCWVVLSVSAALASSSPALGVLLPQPRWSNRMTRYRCASKNTAEFAADPLAMPVPGAYLDFPTAWRDFVDAIPTEECGDVVMGLAKIF